MTHETSIHLQTSQRKTIDLGDGLLMRWSTKADSANVQDLVANAFQWLTFSPMPPGEIPGPHAFLDAGARRLLSGKNAVMSEFDYALVEDTKREKGKNPIVSCVSLHRLRSYYGCVDLFFTKPELIATDKEYRGRGLVRSLLFDMIHPESEARGDTLQFIPGIPHFYRQFGYEYAMCSFVSGKLASVDSLPTLAENQTEPFTLRKATLEDVPLLVSLSTPEKSNSHSAVGLYYSKEYFTYTVHDIFEIAENKFDGDRDTRIVVDAQGKDVGYTIVSHTFGPKIECFAMEDNALYSKALYPVLRQIVALEKSRAIADAEKEAKEAKDTDKEQSAQKEAKTISLSLGFHELHPARQLLGGQYSPGPNKPGFRLYTRVHSYPKFILEIAPELERRLANSAIAGTTGRLQLDFYRKVEGSSGKGLEVVFDQGKIVSAKEWAKPAPEKAAATFRELKAAGKTPPMVYSAAFAPLTFTTLLMGDRSLEDLIWSYGETTVDDDMSRLLLNTLFPKVSHHFDTFFW